MRAYYTVLAVLTSAVDVTNALSLSPTPGHPRAADSRTDVGIAKPAPAQQASVALDLGKRDDAGLHMTKVHVRPGEAIVHDGHDEGRETHQGGSARDPKRREVRVEGRKFSGLPNSQSHIPQVHGGDARDVNSLVRTTQPHDLAPQQVLARPDNKSITARDSHPSDPDPDPQPQYVLQHQLPPAQAQVSLGEMKFVRHSMPIRAIDVDERYGVAIFFEGPEGRMAAHLSLEGGLAGKLRDPCSEAARRRCNMVVEICIPLARHGAYQELEHAVRDCLSDDPQHLVTFRRRDFGGDVPTNRTWSWQLPAASTEEHGEYPAAFPIQNLISHITTSPPDGGGDRIDPAQHKALALRSQSHALSPRDIPFRTVDLHPGQWMLLQRSDGVRISNILGTTVFMLMGHNPDLGSLVAHLPRLVEEGTEFWHILNAVAWSSRRSRVHRKIVIYGPPETIQRIAVEIQTKWQPEAPRRMIKYPLSNDMPLESHPLSQADNIAWHINKARGSQHIDVNAWLYPGLAEEITVDAGQSRHAPFSRAISIKGVSRGAAIFFTGPDKGALTGRVAAHLTGSLQEMISQLGPAIAQAVSYACTSAVVIHSPGATITYGLKQEIELRLGPFRERVIDTLAHEFRDNFNYEYRYTLQAGSGEIKAFAEDKASGSQGRPDPPVAPIRVAATQSAHAPYARDIVVVEVFTGLAVFFMGSIPTHGRVAANINSLPGTSVIHQISATVDLVVKHNCGQFVIIYGPDRMTVVKMQRAIQHFLPHLEDNHFTLEEYTSEEVPADFLLRGSTSDIVKTASEMTF